MIINKLFNFVGTGSEEQIRESGAMIWVCLCRVKERDTLKPSLVFAQKEENHSLSRCYVYRPQGALVRVKIFKRKRKNLQRKGGGEDLGRES